MSKNRIIVKRIEEGKFQAEKKEQEIVTFFDWNWKVDIKKMKVMYNLVIELGKLKRKGFLDHKKTSIYRE